jgi:hypothetical protein
VYNFGLGTNNNPSTARVTFSVTSQGYDSTGTLGTRIRTLYGTNAKRKAYPYEMLEDETGSAPDSVVVRVALSDYIFDDDSSITVTIGAGFYTQGGTPSAAATGFTVTNRSAQPYQKVIANWSWPGFSRVTSTSLTVRAVAFHRSAANGKPVESVKFTATDKHSHTATAWAYRATCDTTRGDAVPMVEYVGTFDLSSMTENDSLVVNFVAYPRIGDERAILNTSDGVNTSPSPLYCPQIYIFDADKSLGVVAVVDSATGSDDTGATVAEASYDPGSPPNKYLTIDGAVDDGANIIYLSTGSYAWSGGTNAATSTYWKEIRRLPGTNRNSVRINSQSGDKDIGQYAKFFGVYIIASGVSWFTGTNQTWHDSCRVDDSCTVMCYNTGTNCFTRCDIDRFTMMRTYAYTTSFPIVRGNTMPATTGNESINYRTFIGNHINDTRASGTYIFRDHAATGTPPAFSGCIVAFNKVRTDVARLLTFGEYASELHGYAIVQNLFEKTATGQSVMQGAADASLTNTSPFNNVLVWNNTAVGQRWNLAYNDYALNDTIPPAWRLEWSMKNNIMDDINIVTDKDGHSGTPDNDRIGNHSIIHGAGSSGNLELARIGAPDDYQPKFFGLYSYPFGNAENPIDPKFLDDQSTMGEGGGNGDYRLAVDSPAQGLAGEVLLPYDIQGHPRSLTAVGDAGAYDDYAPEDPEPEPEPEEETSTYRAGGFKGGGGWKGFKGQIGNYKQP